MRSTIEALLARALSSEFVRYVIAGGVNTAGTLVLYQIFRLFMSYTVAYVIEYCIGIVTAYYLQSRFVFRQPLHWKKAFKFPFVYIVQLAASTALLVVAVEVLHISDVIAPVLVICITVPLTFILSRFIIKG